MLVGCGGGGDGDGVGGGVCGGLVGAGATGGGVGGGVGGMADVWVGDGWWGLVGRLRRFSRLRIASFKLVPASRNGVAGSGLRRMSRRSVRIIVSFSVLDVLGIVQLWGKNSTVLDVRSRFVVGM